MKSIRKTIIKPKNNDELAAHYDFDYSKAKLNRFAKLQKDQMIVLLDKEFTSIFRTPEEVMNALRSLIRAFPTRKSRASKI